MTHSQPQPPSKQPTGRWYFVISWASAGLLASVPHFHAASRLNRPELRKTGTWIAGASIVGLVLVGLAPENEAGEPTGWLSNLAGIFLLALLLVATIQQVGFRREVYPVLGQAPRPQTIDPNEAALAALGATRGRRTEARRLAQKDPASARELGIGRPDRPRQYDDGGLIDLNAVPVEIIAAEFDLSKPTTDALRDIRDQIGRLDSVDEFINFADVPSMSAQLMQERGLVIPEPPR